MALQKGALHLCRRPLPVVRNMRFKASIRRLALRLFNRRKHEQAARVESSGLFDPNWYLESYPDVRESGVDPLEHYLSSGWREGRDPGPSFSTTAYLKANKDVAALGVNPLLHYIEHGRSEGRAAAEPGVLARSKIDPLRAFGPAAACLSFRSEPPSVQSWARAGRIRPEGHELVEVGGLTVGRLDGPITADQARQALATLAWISGWQEQHPVKPILAAGVVPELVDAWHAGASMLHLRWQTGAEPMVARAIQQNGPAPVLIGEGLIGSDLNVVQASLLNSYFPTLFMFTDALGTLLGFSFLAFPSLCRGGGHNLELVASFQDCRPEAGESLERMDRIATTRLCDIRLGRSIPLLKDIQVEVDGVDGASPLFQPEFQAWLQRVMQVGLRPADHDQTSASQFLASCLEVPEGPCRNAAPATLHITGDSIASISALTELASPGPDPRPRAGPIIACGPDATRGGLLVEPGPAHVQGRLHLFPWIEPRSGLDPSADVPPLALRVPAKPAMTDAELLVPKAGRIRTVDGPSGLSWLIFPEEWSEEHLVGAFDTLAMQVLQARTIVLVGNVPARIADRLRTRVPVRLRLAATIDAALSAVDDEYTGYLGSGILLHDRRTSAHLLALLAEPETLSASAPVVTVTRRGKLSMLEQVEPAPAGRLRELWYSTIPVSEPPQHFWISRTDEVRKWVKGALSDGRHLCSTEISVSRLDSREGPSRIRAPQAEAAAARIHVLIG